MCPDPLDLDFRSGLIDQYLSFNVLLQKQPSIVSNGSQWQSNINENKSNSMGRVVFPIRNKFTSNKDQEEEKGQEDIVISTLSAPISVSKMDKNSTSKQFYKSSNNNEHVLDHLSKDHKCLL